MIPVRGYDGHKVAVLGLARSGRPAIAALRAGGAEVVAWDDNPAAREAAEADGIPLADLTKPRSYEGVKALIVSPGIPHLYPAPHPAIVTAWDAGVAVDNDIGLFFRSFATPAWDNFDRMPTVVAITGSNGKSTTTALTAHVMQEAGRPTQIGGNIGRGVLDLDPAEDGMVVVLELSSYQIDLARALQPDIAVFLNLSPDHLDRHGGLGGYFAAKRRLFTLGGPSRAIIGVDENEGRFLANVMREDAATGDPVIAISVTRKLPGDGWTVTARKGFLAEWRHGRQVASIDLRPMLTLPGAHNHQNACAAYAAARSPRPRPAHHRGRPRHLPRPPPPQPAHRHLARRPHRQRLRRRPTPTPPRRRSPPSSASAGSPAAARRRAASPPSRRSSRAIAKAYLIGEAARTSPPPSATPRTSISGTLDAAVAAALAEAEEGDVVLLAPACASFDQFESFEHRGRAFEAAVRAIIDQKTT